MEFAVNFYQREITMASDEEIQELHLTVEINATIPTGYRRLVKANEWVRGLPATI